MGVVRWSSLNITIALKMNLDRFVFDSFYNHTSSSLIQMLTGP